MISRILNIALTPRWSVPLIMLFVGLVELAVANRKYGVFTGGFGQSSAVDTPMELTLFAIGFVLAEIAVGLVAWKLACWLARGSSQQSAVVHFAFLFGGLSLLALNIQYQLHSYFSDAVSFALLKQLGGGETSDALMFAKNEIALGLAVVAVIVGIWAGLVWLLRRPALSLDQKPAAKPAWSAIAIAWLAFFAALSVIPRVGSDSRKGLDRIIAWQGATTLLAAASDFDGDGYGLVGARFDPHPFDGSRHPMALDVPGNGLDEDGYGGDLALVPTPQPLPETLIEGDRKHVVIVVIEGARFDVFGKRINGRTVAPHLEALASEGGVTDAAYSHVAFTTESMKSIFAGSLVPPMGTPSLFRELKKSGYEVSVFSGQPEDFGGISETVGMRASADNFVDAELLRDQRAFSFAAQGSLLVDEQVIMGEFERALGEADQWQDPQFVYFNFQSPHFPYHHPAIPQHLGIEPISRSEIGAGNAERVQQTYWNAVAHSDHALGQVIDHLKRVGAWDDTILLVSGDHGEALFENGFLGHGHMINRLQFGTFLASNRTLDFVSGPVAISDYRRIVHSLLGAELDEAGSFAPFMHIGSLEDPTAIGMTDPSFGIVSVRFDRDEACFGEPAQCKSLDSLAGDERAAFNALVARWGSERWAAQGSLQQD